MSSMQPIRNKITPTPSWVLIVFQPQSDDRFKRETRITACGFYLKLYILFPSIPYVSDQRENLIASLVTEHILIWHYRYVYIF